RTDSCREGSSAPPPRSSESRTAVALDEIEHPLPGACRVVGELLVAAVEEAVRGAGVRDDLVLDRGRGQRFVELGVELGRDVLVVARLERQDRRLDLAGALRWPGRLA